MPQITIIAGGTVINEQERFRADVVVQGERIAVFTTDASDAKADLRIDATGLLVMPGAIDVHTHFREPDPNSFEGFATGSAGAAAGGVTTVI